jgi:hypothetical protein
MLHDVFICHASEDKAEIARPLALDLQQRGVKVWLDEFQIRLGDSLRRKIDEGLRSSAYGVVVLSPSFFLKQWPQWELDGLADRELATGAKVVLPVWHHIDHADVAQYSPLLASKYAARSSSGISHVAAEIMEVLGEAAENTPEIDRVPRSVEEETALLLTRPDGWEYLLFASVLRRQKAALEAKYRDHELGYVQPHGPRLDDQQARDLIDGAFHTRRLLGSNVEKVLAPEAQELAFGPPGDPGDPTRIEHLAQRLIDIYEAFLDWSARLRGANVPDRFEQAVQLLSSYSDGPIEQFRAFVDDHVAQIDRLPAFLSEATEDEPVRIVSTLTLSVDDEAVAKLRRELKKLNR